MKTLPDNPDLDHLRRQAKDLLAGVRESQPEASLADAQASLAQRYGFRTWTDLKAEVDRVRGQADVAGHQLAQAVADRYGLGAVTGQMRSMARANEVGRPWSLETGQGRWMAQSLEHWWPIVDADTDVALQMAAAAEGVLLPKPVRSRSGAVVESIDGRDWRVYDWLHSGPPLVSPASSTVTHTVGETIAKIHGLQLPVDRISPWHASRLFDIGWDKLAAKATAKDAVWGPAMTDAIPTLAGLEEIRDETPAPPVLCHNSLNPGNVRLGEGGRLIVFGWEHAGGQPPDWELANALADWAIDPDGGVNATGAQALLDGYRAEAGTVPSLELASFGGAATGILNYVCGEVELALEAAGGEDQRHADRNVQHLLTHLPSRTSLERLLKTVT